MSCAYSVGCCHGLSPYTDILYCHNSFEHSYNKLIWIPYLPSTQVNHVWALLTGLRVRLETYFLIWSTESLESTSRGVHVPSWTLVHTASTRGSSAFNASTPRIHQEVANASPARVHHWGPVFINNNIVNLTW